MLKCSGNTNKNRYARKIGLGTLQEDTGPDTDSGSEYEIWTQALDPGPRSQILQSRISYFTMEDKIEEQKIN